MHQIKRRCAIYLRISLDRTGEGLAVERQRAACERIARERGWTVAEVYTDNSISASNRHVKRPAYERMVADYNAGRFDAIVCYDLDRLTRQPLQLENWLVSAEERGLALVTANGEADLDTDNGRMFARIKASVAKGEVEIKARRQRDAMAQRVERGVIPSGVRLTGYALRCSDTCKRDHEHERDRATGEVIPEEAAQVRDMFARFNAGESLHAIARRLNEAGVTTRRGAPWRPSSVRTILTNPRYCGRQVFKGEATGHLGSWEPIVSEATFDTTQSILTDPRRITNREGTERKHLGSGLYLCGVCGDRLVGHGGPTRYRCRDGGHVTRSAEQVDHYVTQLVMAWLESPAVGNLELSPPQADDPTSGVIADLRRRLAQVEEDYDDDLIDARRYAAKRDKILAELKAAEKAHRQSRSGAAFATIAEASSPAEAFKNAPLGVRRTIIGEFMEVRLHRAPRGRRTFDPATVEVVWKVAQA